MRNKNISAIILAGGQNKRMNGRDKAKIVVNGRPILERTITVLRAIFSEVFIVANDLNRYNCPGIAVFEDALKNFGPLGGIYTGLDRISSEAGFFVACDMPFLHNEIISRQLELFNRSNCQAIVPRIGDLIEPLHAIYSKCLRNQISRFVKNSRNRSVRGFLAAVDVRYWDLEDNNFNRRSFSNLNTPEDFLSASAND